VAGVIRDPGTASITGAFTLSERRGQGVATALLDAALAWARDRGYVRCAVDFESMNVEARRFWLRWFTPVVLTMARRLDDPGR
jgi:GNAT superfamily N-acetyltransferase